MGVEALDASAVRLGPVLEMLPTLIAEGRFDEVLEAFRVLVEHNEKLTRQLTELADRRRFKPNEGVSSAQLLLFVKQIQAQQHAAASEGDESPTPSPTIAEADKRLLARADAAAERARLKFLAAALAPKQKPLKKPLPEDLPRVEHLIVVPEDQRACPCCSKQREVFGYDVSEVLEVEPAKLFVRRDIRERLGCGDCEGQFVRAPRGDKVVARGQFGCSVVAAIVHDKFGMGLPLHRQRKNFARMGVKLSTSTLCDQVAWAARLLKPLWLEAIDQVLAARVMHIDGSGVRVLDRDHSDGKRLGTLWATVGANENGPTVAAYFYASTKKAKAQRHDEDGPCEMGPDDILAERSGITVSDADTLFAKQRKREDVIDCGCNMHARRYFVEALDRGDSRAALAIGAFKGLYQVEDDIRDLGVDERTTIRAASSTPIYEDLVGWCQAHQPEIRPSEPLGRAINYLLNHELALRRFESDGAIPIDNMAAEHAFVPVALTRKNYLFFGSDVGGDRAAIIYTLLQCCRIAEVEPVGYLTEVMTILGRGTEIEMAELMPARWKNRAKA